MFKEVNKVYQKIFETTQPSGFLWIPSGFHRPKKPCWVTRWFAGPSLQPNQPHQQLPLVQLAPPTKGTRHGSLPCMNFRGHPNDITSGVQTWPIPTSRLIGVETFTSPPNLSACCCCIFSYKTSTVVQLTRPRCIDISDALKFTETLKWRQQQVLWSIRHHKSSLPGHSCNWWAVFVGETSGQRR